MKHKENKPSDDYRKPNHCEKPDYHRKPESPVAAAVKEAAGRNKGVSALVLLFTAGSVLTGLLPPLVLERMVNRLTAGNAFTASLPLIYLLLLSLSGLLEAGKESMITIFGQKVTHQLRSSMCRKLKALPADYFSRQDTGTTVSRFVNDVDTVEILFTSGVISMAADAFRIVSILIVIFSKSPGLGILLLLALPLLYLLTRLFQKRMLSAQMDNRKAVGRANHHVPDTVRSIRMIHNLKKESFMEERYHACIQDSFRAMNRANFYDAVYSPIILTVSAVLIAVMMVLSARGGWVMQLFGMSVGTAVAVISYVGKIFEPLESIGMEIQNIQAADAGIHRINEFLSEPEKKETADSAAPEADDGNSKGRDSTSGDSTSGDSTSGDSTNGNSTNGDLTGGDSTGGDSNGRVSAIPAVQLCGVSFGYESSQEILHEFSLMVQPGEQVTLTGRTGAGKSTVFKLLLGLYEPWKGTVKVFGQNAERVREKDRRKIFGYVEQTFHPVPGTIERQITLGDGRISREQAEAAFQTAGLLDMVRGLPLGIETPYQAELFSQGQIQLLSIARAVAADPQILLLDEITANLDSDTEKRVLDALQAASRNRTVLSISHRLYECRGGRSVELGEGKRI